MDSCLTREEVRSVVERRGAARRVPLLTHMWVHAETFGEREPAVQAVLARYPNDFQQLWFSWPDIYRGRADDAEYRWANIDEPEDQRDRGLDSRVAIPDWELLDGVLAQFPRASYPGLFPENPAPDGRYRLGHWWFCLFERHWSLRGMENALTDYFEYPDEVHRLFGALTDFYCAVIERAGAELQLDGIFTSDDIGTQSGPFFSAAIFHEFFAPYYRRLFDTAHRKGLHFWLHTCGCVEPFLPELIDLGLDVIHPIQKYTMDAQVIADRFGGQLTFNAGFDVQQVIPWGTPEDVRREVRALIDTFQRPDGGLILGAGNGINEDCPVASLEALFDEAVKYGAAAKVG